MSRFDRKSYRLSRIPIGKGGQGIIHSATYKPDSSECAVKKFQRGKARKRAKREINAMIQLTSGYVMPVLGYDNKDYSWYSMPLASCSLEEVRGDLNYYEKVSIINSILSALSLAHKKDIYHRDVNPSNILKISNKSGNEVKEKWVLSDWGAVRKDIGNTSQLLTIEGSAFGTPGYIAPECYVDAHTADHKADIYSLGRLIAWLFSSEHIVPGVKVSVEYPWQDLVDLLTDHDPKNRPNSITDIKYLANELVNSEIKEERSKNSRVPDDEMIQLSNIHLTYFAHERTEGHIRETHGENSQKIQIASMAHYFDGKLHLLIESPEISENEGRQMFYNFELQDNEWNYFPDGCDCLLHESVLNEIIDYSKLEKNIISIFEMHHDVDTLPCPACILVSRDNNTNQYLVRVATEEEHLSIKKYCSVHGITLIEDDFRNYDSYA